MHKPSGLDLARHSSVHFFNKADATRKATRHFSQTSIGAKQCVPVFHPDRLPYRCWTNVLLVLLIWTSTITPFQVSFLGSESQSDSGFWFISERVCDCLFGIDFLINLNTAVYADEATHGALELSRSVIARRYFLSGRALLDLMCTVPWDLVASAMAGDPGSPHAHRAKAARLLRLITLVRMKRVLDAPDRMLQTLRDSTGISHAVTTLCSLLMACFLLSHWLACALHLTGVTQPSQCNWIIVYFNGLENNPLGDPCAPLSSPPSIGSVYVAALYWSVMTVTTVGYGDVAPYTDAERCMGIAGMLVGAVGYAVVIGAACGTVSQMSERSRALESALDTAARLGDSQASNSTAPLPPETLARVRGYLRYVHARGAAWAEGDAVALSARLSPALRAEIALARRGETLRGAHVFNSASPAALAELSSAMSLVTMPPGEVLIRAGDRCDRLSLLRHGLVLTVQSSPVRFRNVTLGSSAHEPEHHRRLADRLFNRAPDAAPPPLVHVPVFGVETLWRNPCAAHGALTLTYTELNIVTRDRLVSILDRHSSLKVAARVYALSCLLVETIRQLGVAHNRIHSSATVAAIRLRASVTQSEEELPPLPLASRNSRLRSATAPMSFSADTGKVSLSRLAPPHQLGAPLPALPGAAAAAPETMVAAVVAFQSAGAAKSAPSSPSVSPETLREGWRMATSHAQSQLNMTLLMVAMQSGAPELWPALVHCVLVLQRYCRRWLMKKRLAVIHSLTQCSLASGSKPSAAVLLGAAPGAPSQAVAEDAVAADDFSLVEAVSLALTPQLRAIAIAVESLISDVAALRNERA